MSYPQSQPVPEPTPEMIRTYCCRTRYTEPHTPGCGFDPAGPLDYAGPAVFVPPIADDVDWRTALAAGGAPGAIWTAVPPEFRVVLPSHVLHAQVTAQLALARTLCADVGQALAVLGIDADELTDVLMDVLMDVLAPWMHRVAGATIAGATDEAEYFDA